MRKTGLLISAFFLLFLSYATTSTKQEIEIIYVPNEATAIKVAETIWVGMWGIDVVNQSRPFHAELKDNIWHVKGTVPPKAEKGGNIHILLQASDCKVIDAWIEK